MCVQQMRRPLPHNPASPAGRPARTSNDVLYGPNDRLAPSIGHPETIGDRTGLYLVMVVCSLLFGLGAVILGQRLAPRLGNWNASLLAAAAFIVAIGIVMLLLPSLGHLSANAAEYGAAATETPQPLRDPSGAIVYPGFPADDLFLFRLYSVGNQLISWATIGLCFAPFASRLLGSGTSPAVDASRL
jgi:Probable cobalt transporter subunit (CbtA)